jgi:hypothetical protein
MSDKRIIWCAHPKHDELLPNGKKRFCKTGSKPSHPKGKRTLDKELTEFINNHHEAIVNGFSKRLTRYDQLCETCFKTEQQRYVSYEESGMDVGNIEEASMDVGNIEEAGMDIGNI